MNFFYECENNFHEKKGINCVTDKELPHLPTKIQVHAAIN